LESGNKNKQRGQTKNDDGFRKARQGDGWRPELDVNNHKRRAPTSALFITFITKERVSQEITCPTFKQRCVSLMKISLLVQKLIKPKKTFVTQPILK
jgi:hypothetical protein